MEISPQIEISTQFLQDSFIRKETIVKTLPDKIIKTCNNINCIPQKLFLPNVYIDKGLIINTIV